VQIPPSKHFAIIRETTVHIPGDERSRTAPGHGYPERDETVISYEICADEKDMEIRILSAPAHQEIYGVYVSAIFHREPTIKVVKRG